MKLNKYEEKLLKEIRKVQHKRKVKSKWGKDLKRIGEYMKS